MKIFGFSLTTILVLFLFYWLGTRFPNSFSGIPILGR